MTRETKIGLLVGLGVIILIGILISDHLSQAQRQQEVQLTQFAPQTQRAMEPPAPGQSGSPQPVRSTAQRPEPLPLPEELAPSSAPVVDEQPAPRIAPTPKPVIFRQDLLALRTVAERSPVIGSLAEETVQPQPADPAPAGADQLAAVTRPVSREELTRIAPDVAVVSAKPQVVHHVQDNESLYSIAERYYGDGNYWKSIFEANRNVLQSPDKVRKGVRLVIPNLAGRVRVQEVQAPSQAARPAQAATKTYVVKSGDSLSKLASRFLGSAGKWQKLYDMNKDRIKNPDVLVAGTEIRVPGS